MITSCYVDKNVWVCKAMILGILPWDTDIHLVRPWTALTHHCLPSIHLSLLE